ncbi:hypothetical protein [Bacillus sp. JCM 19034]|uniref:hypothetical protein n=1 Tax=Bacillus sp. JCM 19034 TaxID=1481928 RepID=UPI0007852F89|nr:hypothetical protein [Bacillus sp. JCM 19034]
MKSRKGGLCNEKILLIILFILGITFLSACGPNTWVLEKERLGEVGSIENYVWQLQNKKTKFRGYRVFTISEGKKMVVVSTGSTDKTLEFTGADVSNNNTTISVEEVSKVSGEENSYILIGINKIKGELTVVNEREEKFIAFE